MTIGQFKLPFSRESLTSGKELDFMDRPAFINSFRPPNGRDVGIMLTTILKDDFKLETGSFNGSGKEVSDTNDQPLWIGRLSGRFTPGEIIIEPETAFIHAPGEDGSPSPLEVSLRNTQGFAPYDKDEYHLGLAMFYRTMSLKYEYIHGRFRPGNTAINTVRADGMYLTIGKQMSGFFKAHVRYENLTYPRQINN